jgi:glycosyltransferase involved in cell wall biosynthesis
MKKMTKFFTSFVALCSSFFFCNAADLIIFSYNRPLQIEALLHSTERITNLQNIYVLYRSSEESFDTAYDELINLYPNVHFQKQHDAPHDFKPLLLEILNHSSAEYICFAVDDIIITDSFDIQTCTDALKQTEAYGFYLRLGKNITYSYTYNMPITPPKLTHIIDDIYLFNFEGNQSYWAYPNTVDMTIYKKKTILPILQELKFTSPNRLESVWHRIANLQNYGLCFSASKIVNIPLNIVQEDWHNKHEGSYTPDELLTMWQLGLRIDIDTLYQLNNTSAHIHYIPKFIQKRFKQYAETPQHITLIIPSYNNAACYERNLASALSQDYPYYDIIYIDDCSTDNTGDLVQDYIATCTVAQNITLIKNDYNRKALANIFKAVHMCKNDDLIVILDGDDFFADNHVLSAIQKKFAQNYIYMSYAQYINVPEELAIAQKIPILGYAKPTPPELIASGEYRKFTGWCWSGLRAFYAGLFKQIKIEDMIFRQGEYKGKFFPTSYDGAIMYPMLEMCGEHFAYIPEILLHRNIDTPLNDFKIHRELQRECGKILRSLAPYKRLKEPPIQAQKRGKADLIIIATDNIEEILERLDINAFENMHVLSKPTTKHEELALLREIKKICRKSKADHIMLANHACTFIPIKKALYWLSHSDAVYIYCDTNLIDDAVPITQQPIEHIDGNLYAVCTDFHHTLSHAWCGLFNKDRLLKYLHNCRSLKRLHANISDHLKKKNRALLCAV